MSNLSKPENTDTASVMAKAEALENRPGKPVALDKPKQAPLVNSQVAPSVAPAEKPQADYAGPQSSGYSAGHSLATGAAAAQALGFQEGVKAGIKEGQERNAQLFLDSIESVKAAFTFGE
jgi:hypothetical protein